MTTNRIVQVDAVLCEDGRTVMLTGHTDDDDVTFIQSFSLPTVIEEGNFLPDEWKQAARPDRWHEAMGKYQ